MFDGKLSGGQRLALFGRAGSGKTYLSQWMLLRSKLKWIVLDTKHDPNFDEWRPVGSLIAPSRMSRLWQDRQHIVIRPGPEQSTPQALDHYLYELHDSFENFGILIDETYQVAYGPKAGPGLTGLITRGRARKQAVICGSQRPAWVPRFVFTEANYYIIMSLNIAGDRKTVYDFTGKKRVLDRVEPRHWLHYDVASDQMTAYRPVKIVNEGS